MTPIQVLAQLRNGEIPSFTCGVTLAEEIASSDGTLTFGIEYIDLPDGSVAKYVNMGDTYQTTLVSFGESHEWFLSSWGDVLETAQSEHLEETGEESCCYCGAIAQCERYDGPNWSGSACEDCRA